jgi:NADP-dependent aldehyde dehydrogenase
MTTATATPTTYQLGGKHLIDGAWIESQGEKFQPENAATGEKLTPAFHDAGSPEVDQALRAARTAFEQTRDLEPRWTAQLLNKIAERVMDLGDALLERGEAETGLPRARLTGERLRTVNQLKLFADVVQEGSWVDAIIDRADPKRQPLPKPDVRRTLQPIGPVVVFDASNFPFAFGPCGNDTASALAGGNPVIVKAHRGHPGTDEMFAAAALEALIDLGLPRGLFGLLQGRGTVVGEALAKHPLTEAIGFTGSLRGGRSLFDVASRRERPIPVYAEMGSINPLVVLPGAIGERADAIADGLAKSITMGTGQFCTKPGVVLVLKTPESQKFVAALAKHLGALPPMTMLSKRFQEGFGEVTQRMQATPGVRTVVPGKPAGHAQTTAWLFETDAKQWRENHKVREEAFGPGSVVVHCENIDELKATIRETAGQLTGTVHAGSGDDAKLVRDVIRTLETGVGRVILNGFPTGVEVNHAMVHGGPYPATTAPHTTSVGAGAIYRFVRPVAYQDVPDALLPGALQNANSLGIFRKVDGKPTSDPIA